MWILNLTALLLKIIHTKTTSKESFWTNCTLYMNAVFWLVDKRGIFDQFRVFSRFFSIAGAFVLGNSVWRHLPFFFTLYRWLKEETWVIRNYIHDVINYLNKGFSLERDICLLPWYLQRHTEFPRTNTPAMEKKREKTRHWSKIRLLSVNIKSNSIAPKNYSY
jgi:hypothetical protein